MKDYKTCELCGEKVDVDLNVCPACGDHFNATPKERNTQTPPPASKSSMAPNRNDDLHDINDTACAHPEDKSNYSNAKNKWITFFLCIMFGAWGAHKFYEGRFGLGIVYALTLGFFGIGIIIDLIKILSLPETYYIDKTI